MADIHVASECLENGSFDNDCCVAPGTGSCRTGYAHQESTEICYSNFAVSTICTWDCAQAIEFVEMLDEYTYEVTGVAEDF
jgi:hypothetical protein